MRFLRNLWRAIKGWPKCDDCGERFHSLFGETGACRWCAFYRYCRSTKMRYDIWGRLWEGKK